MQPVDLLHELEPSEWKDRWIFLQKIRDSEAGGLHKSVKQEEFFHGFIPASEASLFLKEEGDFLVRQTVKMEKKIGHEQFEISVRLKERKMDTYIKKEDEDWFQEWEKAGRTTSSEGRIVDGSFYESLKNNERDRYKVLHGGIGHFPMMYSRRGRLFYMNGYGFSHTPGLIDYHLRHKISVSKDNPYAVLKKAVPKQKWQFNHEQICTEKKLGSGAFGEVFRGTLRLGLLTTREVAVKTIKSLVSTEENEKLFEEAKITQRMRHKHVVKLLGIATNDDPLMIVMELCGQSVEKTVKTEDVSLSRKINFIYGAALGLQYIHKFDIVHGDLAARNTLIGKGDVAKISDFGLAITGGGKKYKANMERPTRYLAPQSLRVALYNASTDMWSFGVYIYEVFNNAPELYSWLKDVKEIKEFVTSGKRLGVDKDVQYPHFLWELTKLCWTRSSVKRIKIDELVEKIETADREQNGSKWFRRCRQPMWSEVKLEKPIENGWEADDIAEEKKEIEENREKYKATKAKNKKKKTKNQDVGTKSDDMTTKTADK